MENAVSNAVLKETVSEEVTVEKLSTIIESFQDAPGGVLRVREMVQRLDAHGMAAVLILFSIPSALPVPAAGYSTLLSIPLFVIGLRLISGKRTIWLWNKVLDKEVNFAERPKLISKTLTAVRFVERFTKPRLKWFTSNPLSYRLLGVLTCALACSMALPIPGTNTLPAGGIFLIGFGLLEEDGLALLAGVVYSVLALCISAGVIYGFFYLGTTGVSELLEYIKG